MPQYDYCCSSCQHHFEEDQSVSNMLIPTTLPCPNCHTENTIEKVFTAPNVIFDSTRLNFRKRMDPKLKDKLQEIATHHPKHKMNI